MLSLIYFFFNLVFYIQRVFVAQLLSWANNLVSKCRSYIYIDQYKTKFYHILRILLL